MAFASYIPKEQTRSDQEQYIKLESLVEEFNVPGRRIRTNHWIDGDKGCMLASLLPKQSAQNVEDLLYNGGYRMPKEQQDLIQEETSCAIDEWGFHFGMTLSRIHDYDECWHNGRFSEHGLMVINRLRQAIVDGSLLNNEMARSEMKKLRGHEICKWLDRTLGIVPVLN